MYIQRTNFGTADAVRCSIHKGRYHLFTHMHQFSEIIYVINGSIEITADEKTEVANKGDIVVIAPFKAHSFYTPEYCEIWMCLYSNEMALNLVTTDELYSGGETLVFTPSEELKNFVGKHLVDSDEKIITEDGHIMRSVKTVVCAVLEEHTRVVERTVKSSHSGVISSLLLYMNEHAKENITQKSVCAVLGYSTGYISRCIKMINNMNFCTLLNSFRVEHAKNYLVSTDRKVTEIAYESGFSSERSFHRAFLKNVGMTPGEYRKTYKKK